MAYGRRPAYKRTRFGGTAARSGLAKARQKNARTAKTTMRRSQATAKVAAAALRLARANRVKTFGNVQKGLYTVTLPSAIKEGYPACFLMTAMHAPGNSESGTNGLPLIFSYPATLTGAFTQDSQSHFFKGPTNSQLTGGMSDARYNQWAGCNDAVPNGIYKWDWMSLTFSMDVSTCRDVECIYRIDFVTQNRKRFERPSTQNSMQLPEALSGFTHLVNDYNSINSIHWKRVRPPVFLKYKPHADDIIGQTRVAKTVFFRKPGNQTRGIQIDNPSSTDDSFVKGGEHLQIPQRDLIWVVISSNIPDAGLTRPTDNASITPPSFDCKCVCQWRDDDGTSS